MIKGWIQEEDITFINIYAPNIGASKYIKQILTEIKGEIDRNTMIVGDSNTSLTLMNRSCRQKINKATEILNDTTDTGLEIDSDTKFHIRKLKEVIHINNFQ